MSGTPDPSALDRLEEDHEVRVSYTSSRSGNEVTRSGPVNHTKESDDSKPIVYIHDGEKEPFKHTYVVLTSSVTAGGDPCIAAFSLTAEPDGLEWESGPDLSTTYSFKMKPERTTLLGVVTKLVRTDGPSRYVLGES